MSNQQPNKLSPRWVEYFRGKMLASANMSKDANTKVGAVIFCEKNKVELSSGWNDLPRGVEHTPERNSRPLKYKLTVHAEANAVANAARLGVPTSGASIIVSMFPCSICAGLLVNAGILRVYSPPPDMNHISCGEDYKYSLEIFEEAGVEIVYLESIGS